MSVVDSVSKVLVLANKNVEDGEDLTVVGDEGLANEVLSLGPSIAVHESLEDLQDADDDLLLSCVKSGLDGDNKLRDDRKYLVRSGLHHVVNSLGCEEAVGLLDLAEAIKEDGEVMVEVKLFDSYLPSDTVVNSSMVNLDREISTLIESAELSVGWVGALSVSL